MIADEIRAAYSRTKWSLILRGILGIVLGVLILARPFASLAAFALAIAVWAVVDGVVNIARSLMLNSVVRHWWVLLLAGLVGVLFGSAALFYYPTLSLTFAVVWVGFWLISSGAFTGYAALRERELGLPWGWTMAVGMLAIVCGALSFANPGATLASFMWFLAGFGIFGGIAMIVGAARLARFRRAVEQATNVIDRPPRSARESATPRDPRNRAA